MTEWTDGSKAEHEIDASCMNCDEKLTARYTVDYENYDETASKSAEGLYDALMQHTDEHQHDFRVLEREVSEKRYRLGANYDSFS